MDTVAETNSSPENGSKIMESSSDPPGELATIIGKDRPSTPTTLLKPRETRSRSRTPQKKKDKKNEDNLKQQLKKLDENVNGQEEKKKKKKPIDGTEADNSKSDSPKDESVNSHEDQKTRVGEKKKSAVEEIGHNSKNDSPKNEHVDRHEEKKARGGEKKKKSAVEQIEDTSKNYVPEDESANKHEGKKARGGEKKKKSAVEEIEHNSQNDNRKDKHVNRHEEKKARGGEKKTKSEEEIEDASKNAVLKDESASRPEEKEARGGEKKNKSLEDAKNAAPKDGEERKFSEIPKAPKQSSETTNNKPGTSDNGIEIVEPEGSTKSNSDHPSKPETDAVDMDPLVLAMDEPDPELLFDENSDRDSGKGSPILARCKTRRSHTRHIPTPKTPKSATDSESEKTSVAPTPTPENLNDTNDSCLNIDDASTRAEAGDDSQSLDCLSSTASMNSEDNSYLNYSRDRSLSETLRGLSSRRTIRPLNDSYRQKAFKNNIQKKPDLIPQYSPDRDSVDRIVGVKRRRSMTPEQNKRQKTDSATGFVSYLSSPLSNFTSRFISDGGSSTPKLTSYKDSSKNIHEEEYSSEELEKKSPCAIM